MTKYLLLGGLGLCLSSCIPQPPDGEAAIFREPSRYGFGSKPGSPGGPPPEQQQQPQSNGSRFGHNDGGGQASGPTTPAPGTSPDADGSSTTDSGNTPDSAAGPGSQAGTPDSGSPSSEKPPSSGGGPASTPPANLNSYPYARLVPGKKGFVTLPGGDAAVGEIDVTGIKPGTPVEINDPRNQSKKIYFRVP
jgi:hypothetical protein